MQSTVSISNSRVVIACFEVPGYGGASTSTYALFKKLQLDGLNVQLINLVASTDKIQLQAKFGSNPGNPDSLANVYTIFLGEPLFGQHDRLQQLLVTLQPDALLAIGKVAAHILGSARPDLHLIYYMSGFDQMTPYFERGLTNSAVELLGQLDRGEAPKFLDRKEYEVFQRADLIIPHSDLTSDLARRFYPFANWKTGSRTIWKGDFISAACSDYLHLCKPFSKRTIDVLFVATNWRRPLKNLELVKNIASQLGNRNIHLVGDIEDDISGIECHGFIARIETLLGLMGDARVLVCPSQYDAAPGVIYQAATMGCKIVTSQNCGNAWLAGQEYLAEHLTTSTFVDKIECALDDGKPVLNPTMDTRPGYLDLLALLNEYLRNLSSLNSTKRGLGGVVYYLWHYPCLSETFIQRELGALKRLGVNIHIIAESADETTPLCDQWIQDADEIQYLGNRSRIGLSTHAFRLLFKQPLKSLYWYLRVRLTGYHYRKHHDYDLGTWLAAMELAAYAKGKNIALMHSPWGDRSAYVTGVAAKLARVPFSLQLRAHDLHRDVFRIGLKAKLNLARRVITNTRYNVPFVFRLLKQHDQGKLRQIYNGLELWRYTPPAHRSTETFNLIAVGRITQQKGYVDLLRAVSKLLPTIPHLKLRIIGDTERPRSLAYEKELMELHQSLRLRDHVEFLGAIEHQLVIKWMHQSDIFVLPCVVDNDNSRDIIPNAILEAMAMELPVVSTTLAGVPEMVIDGETGILVCPGDVDGLANAMETFHSNIKLRQQMGRMGRKRIELQFNIDSNAMKYTALYRDIVSAEN